MKTFLRLIMQGQSLSVQQAEEAMAQLCNGEQDLATAAAFLAALHLRGETKAELLGFIRYLRSQALALKGPEQRVLDTCGTGGDYQNTFNISTAAALLVASQGVLVAKHGGRAVSSLSGSAEVLAALDIQTETETRGLSEKLIEKGFVFLHAPQFNPALQAVAPLRKVLGVRTCFNLLGPLLNPLLPKHQVLGVYSQALLVPVAELLAEMGSTEVMVVHAKDGLDEFSIAAATEVVHLKEGCLRFFTLDPKSLGFHYSCLGGLRGGTPKQNAEIIKRVLQGEAGPQQAAVILNAAAALIVVGRAENFAEGVELCRQQISKGAALDYLNDLRGVKS